MSETLCNQTMHSCFTNTMINYIIYGVSSLSHYNPTTTTIASACEENEEISQSSISGTLNVVDDDVNKKKSKQKRENEKIY